MRIVSLVPSLTLLLFDLGLGEQVVGRTKFCIHPKPEIDRVPVVGGTKDLKPERIRELQPDLILANKEENEKEQIQALKGTCRIVVTEVKNLEDNYRMIEQIGRLTHTEQAATALIEATQRAFGELDAYAATLPPLHCLYLIWRKPYMSIGKDTFIHDMLSRMGWKNMFGHQTRYPIIQNLNTSYFARCEVVLLSSEPYPFAEKHLAEIRAQLPHARILLVDGELFSWYGSKIQAAPAYFMALLQKAHELSEP